jgi:uncharacterized membrane protein
MKPRNLDLIAGVSLVALLTISVELLPQVLLLRLVLTMAMVFFVPGYLLLCAMAPVRVWELAELGTTSVGLSLALTVMAALLLNALNLGILTENWLVFYSVHCLAAALIALIRRYRHPLEEPPRHQLRLRLVHVLPVLLAIVVVVSAWLAGSISQTIQHEDRFTQLWLIPCTTDACDVEFGVYSYEWSTQAYSLVVRARNRLLQTYDFSLPHDQTWTMTLTLPADYPTGFDLSIDLYLAADRTAPYRSVVLRDWAWRD